MKNKETLNLHQYSFEAIQWNEDHHVLELTLNRPEKKNAINKAMANELCYALDYAAQEDNIRVVLISANGDVFCAGGDLRSMRGEVETTASTVPNSGDLNDIGIKIRQLCKPVVIKAQGSVLAGALLLVSNATHVVVARHAKFSAPEIKRGLWPYMVMAGLFRLIPKRVGLDFIMRGYEIDADTALQWGLVNRVVYLEKLDTTVATLIEDLRNLPPKTMKIGLEAYNKQEAESFEDAMPYLASMLDLTLKEGDAKEGIDAFLEKRQPGWLKDDV